MVYICVSSILLFFAVCTSVHVSFEESFSPAYEDSINYDDLVSESKKQTAFPFTNTNSYDYDLSKEENSVSLNSYWNKYQLVLLNNEMKVECPLSLKSVKNKFLNKFKFGEILFYKSVHDFNLVNFDEQVKNKNVFIYEHENTLYFKLKSKKVFKSLFNNLISLKENVDRWQSNKLIINNTRFSDSGRYYCVYSYKGQYLITGNLYVIYEDEILRKSFNELARLEPAVDKYSNDNRNSDTKNIQWKFNNLSAEYVHINDQDKSLEIKLDNLELFFDTYTSQNIKNGAMKTYKIECTDCESFYYAPIISPVSQSVPEDSSTQFTCDKRQSVSNSQDVDRYKWFKLETNPNKLEKITDLYTYDDLEHMSDAKQLNVSGPILDIVNVSRHDSGWFMCCYIDISSTSEIKLLLSTKLNLPPSSNTFSTCSSAELNVFNTSSVKNQTKQRPKLNTILLTFTIGLLGFVLLMSIFVVLCYRRLSVYRNAHKGVRIMQKNEFYQKRNEFDLSSMSSDQEEILDLSADLKNFKDILKSSSSIEALLDEKDVKRWRIPLGHLKFGHTLGRGAFGVVVYGKLKKNLRTRSAISCTDSGLDTSDYQYIQSTNLDLNYVDVVNMDDGFRQEERDESISVAIKKLPETATTKNYYDLFKELNLMFQVGQHKHIVNLIGYCIEDTSLFIIIDYAKHGNLKDFLRKHQTENTLNLIGPKRLLLYSYQTALGMQYLHSKKVLHRDLAARNILVSDYDSIKIADFGLARNMKSDYYYMQKLNNNKLLPLKWMSPESLQFSRISKESDVWSYGILLWEMYSYGCNPYPSLPLENILEKVISGYRMEKPKDCDDIVYESVMLKCWNIDPKMRPTFTQLVTHFETLAKKPDYSCLEPLATEKLQITTTVPLILPPKAQPEELTPFLNQKRNQNKLSAQSSSSNWSECSTEQTHTQISDLSNSLLNRSYASSTSQNRGPNLFLENDHTDENDVKNNETFSKNKNIEFLDKDFKLVESNPKKDIDFIYKSFDINEDYKKKSGLAMLAKKHIINLFIKSNSENNRKTNILIGKN